MRARPLLFALLAALELAACGASLRRVHRASAYFEACYAADQDPSVPDAERRACWQAWKRAYRIGATPERLDYVRERLAMLDPDRAAAITLATGDEAAIDTLDGASEPTAETTEAVAPAPTESTTSASTPAPVAGPTPSEAAPPDTSDEQRRTEERHARARERHLRRDVVAPSTVTPSCPCDGAWSACAAGCLADDRGCVAACRRAHTLCSRSCY